MAKTPAPSNSMDQVRDLLMGTQLKDMENKFQRQEDRLLREISDLRDSFKSRIESLENFMKSETSTLMHRLREEQTERAAAIKDEQRERLEALKNEQRERQEAMRADSFTQLAKDLSALEEAIDRKLTALSGTLDTAERELRHLMLSENARLSNNTDEKYKEALDALSTTASQIRHDMASRSQVSGLFTEMAVKLSGYWSTDDETEALPEPSPTKSKAKDASAAEPTGEA